MSAYKVMPADSTAAASSPSWRLRHISLAALNQSIYDLPVQGEDKTSALPERSASGERGWWSLRHPMAREVIGMGQFETRPLAMIGRNNLDGDRETLATRGMAAYGTEPDSPCSQFLRCDELIYPRSFAQSSMAAAWGPPRLLQY